MKELDFIGTSGRIIEWISFSTCFWPLDLRPLLLCFYMFVAVLHSRSKTTEFSIVHIRKSGKSLDRT